MKNFWLIALALTSNCALAGEMMYSPLICQDEARPGSPVPPQEFNPIGSSIRVAGDRNGALSFWLYGGPVRFAQTDRRWIYEVENGTPPNRYLRHLEIESRPDASDGLHHGFFAYQFNESFPPPQRVRCAHYAGKRVVFAGATGELSTLPARVEKDAEQTCRGQALPLAPAVTRYHFNPWMGGPEVGYHVSRQAFECIDGRDG